MPCLGWYRHLVRLLNHPLQARNTRPNLSRQDLVVDYRMHGNSMTATAISGSGSGTPESSATFRNGRQQRSR